MIDRPRLILIGGIVVGAAVISALLYFRGYEAAFGLWHFTLLQMPFLDIRLITGGAESLARGFDPAIYDPGDPRGRIFNYPKVWYLVLASGIDNRWAVPLALAMILLFLVAVVAFPGRLRGSSPWLILLALASSATMLGIARANVELIIFSLMVLSLIVLERSALASFGLMLVAILFKIVPVLGIGGLLSRDRTTSVRLLVGSILFTLLYFLLDLKDMLFTFNTTERGTNEAYGVGALPLVLDQIVQDHVIKVGPLAFYKLVTRLHALFLGFPALPYIAAVLILVLLAWLGLRRRLLADESDWRNLRAFWMGAGMYIGTFLIASNWDYRMIFLILTIPQLVEWAAGGHRAAKWTALLALVMLFISMWYSILGAILAGLLPIGPYLAALLTSAANWVLFGSLVYLFFASLPAWLTGSPLSLLADLLPPRTVSARGVQN